MPLISRTQPESVLLATSGNPATYHSNFKHFKKNLNLRMHNHSPSRNQPTTSSKLKQPTNFHHAPLQRPATNKHHNQANEQSSSKLMQHHNQRTNQLEASTTTQSVASALTTVCRQRYLQNPNRLTVMSFNKFHVTLKIYAPPLCVTLFFF